MLLWDDFMAIRTDDLNPLNRRAFYHVAAYTLSKFRSKPEYIKNSKLSGVSLTRP